MLLMMIQIVIITNGKKIIYFKDNLYVISTGGPMASNRKYNTNHYYSSNSFCGINSCYCKEESGCLSTF